MLQFERIALITVWTIDPDLFYLINKLNEKGFIVARIKPSHEAYNIEFLERSGTIAIKESSRVYYQLERKTLGVEGIEIDKIVQCFKEVEAIFEEIGINVGKTALICEAQVKARLTDLKFPLKKLNTEKIVGFNINYFPSLFVMENMDPNTSRWFNFSVDPIWPTWYDEERRSYNLKIVYRDEKEKIVEFIKNLYEIINQIIEKIVCL